jgi:NADPH-dependent ferric siderophore reductase
MTTQTTAPTAPAVLVTQVTVEAVEQLSPAFVRVTFGGPGLGDLSTADGFDTRFKVVFPGPTGELPPLAATPEEWQAGWLAMPDQTRSPMRTYTIREIRSHGDTVHLVTDFVVHEGDPAELGPACQWALAARPGDMVQVVAPHRLSPIYGGTEFDPGDLHDLLLIGDETAVPAVARILADADPGCTGHAFLEVPSPADVLDLPRHPGITVTWLPRNGRRQGRPLVDAVRSHLGLAGSGSEEPLPEVTSSLDVEVWETARYSSAGEDLEAQLGAAGHDLAGTYAWIAGESWAVKALRRALVSELDVDRARVAFMGYWREGVSMRS